jgi:hypothetical protein
MGNGKGVAVRFLGGTCGLPELPRGDADEALEVTGELALVRVAGIRGDLRQGQVAVLQELLGPLDAAGDLDWHLKPSWSTEVMWPVPPSFGWERKEGRASAISPC